MTNGSLGNIELARSKFKTHAICSNTDRISLVLADGTQNNNIHEQWLTKTLHGFPQENKSAEWFFLSLENTIYNQCVLWKKRYQALSWGTVKLQSGNTFHETYHSGSFVVFPAAFGFFYFLQKPGDCAFRGYTCNIFRPVRSRPQARNPWLSQSVGQHGAGVIVNCRKKDSWKTFMQRKLIHLISSLKAYPVFPETHLSSAVASEEKYVGRGALVPQHR